MQPVPREPRGAMRRLLPIALAVAVPWLWFAVRAAGGPIDSVAVGLPLLGLVAVVGSAILAVVAGRAWPLAAGISLFAVCAVAVLAPRLPRAMAPPDPSIRLVLANVWDANPTPQAAPGSMIARDPDLLVAVEMPRDHDFYGSMTADAAGADLGFAVEDGELGVWSRYPIRELGDLGLPPARVVRVGVDAPGTPFVLYAVHALNPLHDTSFTDQRRFTDELLAAIARERRPVVVAGDFNMSDRVVSYREMDDALTDAMRADVAGRTTYVGGWWSPVLLRIDHVFVSPAWCAADPATFTVTGSDHRGVEVAVGPCAEAV